MDTDQLSLVARLIDILRRVWRKLLSFGLFLIVPLILLYVFGFSIKTSEEYRCVIQTAEQNAQIIAITGEPITPGLFAWTTFFESGGGLRRGQFSTTISGPSGRGTLQASFYRAPIGASLGIWFRVAGEELQVYNGTYPCR